MQANSADVTDSLNLHVLRGCLDVAMYPGWKENENAANSEAHLAGAESSYMAGAS
jgi:hypothetical protein